MMTAADDGKASADVNHYVKGAENLMSDSNTYPNIESAPDMPLFS